MLLLVGLDILAHLCCSRLPLSSISASNVSFLCTTSCYRRDKDKGPLLKRDVKDYLLPNFSQRKKPEVLSSSLHFCVAVQCVFPTRSSHHDVCYIVFEMS